MNTAREYRCRQTGEEVRVRDIPTRASVTRYLPEMVERKGKMVQPKLFHISPPNNEEDFDQYLFDLADIDPVFPTTPPERNQISERLVKLKAVKVGKKWKQAWKVEDLHETIEEKRAAAIEYVKSLASLKRDKGIVVNGIPVRTDTTGIARVSAAFQSGVSSVEFVVGEESWKLSQAKIGKILSAIGKHVQSTYTERARLTKLIKKSDSPFDLDLSKLK